MNKSIIAIALLIGGPAVANPQLEIDPHLVTANMTFQLKAVSSTFELENTNQTVEALLESFVEKFSSTEKFRYHVMQTYMKTGQNR